METMNTVIELNRIVPNKNNPRKVFDRQSLDELKQSIEKYGLAVPIKVRPNGGDNYEIVYGERRFKAFQELGKISIPCIVESLDDKNAIISAGIENISRGNLNYLEEGEYYHNLLENKVLKSQQEIADTFGVSQMTVNVKVKVYKSVDFNNIVKNLTIADNGFNNIVNLIPLTHALELTRLHPDNLIAQEEKKSDGTLIKKRIADVINEVVTDETLRVDYLNEFNNLCTESQTDLIKEIINKNLTLKVLQDRVKNHKSDIINKLTDKMDDERNKKCWYIKNENSFHAVYNKESQLISNDFDINISGFDEKKRKFGQVHLIVTSPPYFVGMNYEKHTQTIENHVQILLDVFKECSKILVPGGKLCINIGDIVPWSNYNTDGHPEEHLIWPHLIDGIRHMGLRLYGRIFWVKDEPWVNSPHVTYHEKSLHGEYRILPNVEYLFIFKKDGKRNLPDQSIQDKSSLTKEEWKEYVNAAWNIRSVQKNDIHEAMFPDELIERIIKMYSYIGDVVCDPFAGSGTVGRVSKNMNRNSILYERQSQYYELIKNTLSA